MIGIAVELQDKIWEATKHFKNVYPEWIPYLNLVDWVENNTWCDTMATDGLRLFYNRKFVEGLTQGQMVFLLAHELAHVASRHHLRVPPKVKMTSDMKEKSKLMRKWNVACDAAIHNWLKPETDIYPEMEWFEGGVYMPEFDGKDAEYIFDHLPENSSQYENTHTKVYIVPKGSMGDDEEGKPVEGLDLGEGFEVFVVGEDGEIKPCGSKELEELKEMVDSGEINTTGIQAGSEKAERARIASKLKKVPNTLAEKLKQFTMESMERAREEYSYSRPSRSYLHQGLIVPTLCEGSTLVKGAVMIDVSGSIDDNIYTAFCSQIENIRKELPECELDIYWVNTQIVKTIKDVRIETPVNWSDCPSGGGTSFVQFFDTVNVDPPKFCLVLTDGYVYDIKSKTVSDYSFPTLWAVYEGGQMDFSFGEVVDLGKVEY